MSSSVTAESIIAYWYSDKIKSQWFNSTTELDQEIKDKYEGIWKEAIRGDYKHWNKNAEGCLALAILFDQFPLNMFRGEVKSFSSEGLAVKVAKNAVKNSLDKKLIKEQLSFLYIPLMHSENLEDQNLCVKLFEQAKLMDNWRFAKHHRNIILKFGRFPHRNKILNRQSSGDELDYLNSDEAFRG